MYVMFLAFEELCLLITIYSLLLVCTLSVSEQNWRRAKA